MALYTDNQAAPGVAIEGLLVDSPAGGTDSYVAENAVRAGFAIQYGTDRLTTRQQVTPLTVAPVADADAIAIDLASVVAPAALTAVADLDGIIGIERINPPRVLTMTFDADIGHDGPLGYVEHTIYGDDANGHPISERFIRNNAGAVQVVLTGRSCFARVRQVDVGASNAATGLIDIGVDDALMELGTLDNPGIPCYDIAREPSAVAAVTFDAFETLSCVRIGHVWAVCVAGAAPGEPVHVRVTAGGGGLGSLYGVNPMPAAGAYATMLGAKWTTLVAATELGLIEIGMGG